MGVFRLAQKAALIAEKAAAVAAAAELTSKKAKDRADQLAAEAKAEEAAELLDKEEE